MIAALLLGLVACRAPEAPEGTWYLTFEAFDAATCPPDDLSPADWHETWRAWPTVRPGGVADLALDGIGAITGYAVFDPGAALASGPVDGWVDGREGELAFGDGAPLGVSFAGDGFVARGAEGDELFGDRCSTEDRCAGRCR